MLQKLSLLFRIPELRRKILLTLGLLAVYRMGFYIPLPFIDQEKLFSFQESVEGGQQDTLGQVMQVVSLFSASNIGNSTIKGVDLDVDLRATPNTLLSASVQYLHGKYDSFTYFAPDQGLPPNTACAFSPTTQTVNGVDMRRPSGPQSHVQNAIATRSPTCDTPAAPA